MDVPGCGFCKHWSAVYDIDRHDRTDVSLPMHGFCCRFPPVPVSGGPSNTISYERPRLMRDDFCGEFLRAPPYPRNA